MNFNLHIKNVGKLSDAKIRIGRFTVLAGPNNTGKSFVSKIVYSFFNAMNANHAEVHINNLTDSLSTDIDNLLGFIEESEEFLSPLQKEIDILHNLVMKCPVGDSGELEKIIPALVKKAHKMREMYPDIISPLEDAVYNIVGYEDEIWGPFRGYSHSLKLSLINLEKNLNNTNAIKFIISGIEYEIRENLIRNFQIPNLADLKGTEEMSSQVYIKDFGTFEFLNGNIEFEIGDSLLRKFQQLSNVIYVESPVYWKLKNALEDLRIRPRYTLSGRERLSGVPGYFYDLASALKSEYTGDMAFPNVHKKLTGKEVLGGKVVISDSGALLFQENGRSFSLPVTAMGVANLGVLALLIERKILDRESFLFIDEPEAHLHPSWQVVMAEALFELAKGGANVVIATHSADILKWLEVHIKKHPEDEKLVALNKFPANGDESIEQDFDHKIAAIKQELTKPFADLYTAGL